MSPAAPLASGAEGDKAVDREASSTAAAVPAAPVSSIGGAMRFTTLKRPAEFRRIRGGVRIGTKLFVIEGRARAGLGVAPAGGDAPEAGAAPQPIPRFGFTITRKVGNAVVRNRIRRRLREALRTLETPFVRSDHDYVVVASRATHDYPFAELRDALLVAFEQLHQQAESVSSRGGQRKRRPAGKGGSSVQRASNAPKPPDSGEAGGERNAPAAAEPHAAAPDHGKRGRATEQGP